MIGMFLLSFEGLLSLILGAIIFVIFLVLAIYIYSSIALMKIAKRTNTPNAWLAWIPYANMFLTAKIAQKHWWSNLLIFVPTILGFISNNVIFNTINYLAIISFLIFVTIWWWKICERLGKPGWWAIITIIPIIGWAWSLIMLGILAWGKENNSFNQTSSIPTPQPKLY